MPTARSEISVAKTDYGFVVAGGIARFRTTDNCEAFHTNTQAWRTCPELPMPLHHVALAASGNTVWAGGGYVSLGFRHLSNPPLWQLQPESTQWETVGELPFAVGEHALVELAGTLYLVGGRTESGASNQLWRYRDAKWVRLADMKVPRHSFASATRPGRLWVLGGRDDVSDGIASVEVYNTATDQWQMMPNLPIGSGGAVATTLRDEVHIVGGELLSKSSVLNQHWRFDVDQNQWLPASALPIATHGAAATHIDDRMYLVGGATRAGLRTIYSVSNKLWVFEPNK